MYINILLYIVRYERAYVRFKNGCITVSKEPARDVIAVSAREKFAPTYYI